MCTYVDMLGNVLDAIFVNSEECSGSVKSCTSWKRIKKIVLLVADVNYGVPKYTECAGNEPDVMLLGNAQKVLEEDQQLCLVSDITMGFLCTKDTRDCPDVIWI